MWRFLYLIIGFLVIVFTTQAQTIKQFDKFEDLEMAVLTNDSTTYVINFWATWCAPCVKELPYFEQLQQENNNLEVILVSLDFKDQFKEKLVPFVEKKDIKSTVVFLSDKDYNRWIPQVSDDWSGAIPATWIVRGNQRRFVEGEFANYEALDNFVQQFLKQ